MKMCPGNEYSKHSSLLNVNRQNPTTMDLLRKLQDSKFHSLCQDLLNQKVDLTNISNAPVLSTPVSQKDEKNMQESTRAKPRTMPRISVLKSYEQVMSNQTDRMKVTPLGTKSHLSTTGRSHLSSEVSSYLQGKSYDQLRKRLKVSRICETDKCIFKSKEAEKQNNSSRHCSQLYTPGPPHPRRRYQEKILEDTPEVSQNSHLSKPQSQNIESLQSSPAGQQPKFNIKLSPIAKRRSKKPVYRPAYEVLNKPVGKPIYQCMQYFRDIFLPPKKTYRKDANHNVTPIVKTSTPETQKRCKHQNLLSNKKASKQAAHSIVCTNSCRAHCLPNYEFIY